MERLLVIVITLGLSVCQQPSLDAETEYREERQYVYKYESQVLSGLPVGTRTYAGIKLTAEVIIQISPQWKSKMQLHTPRLYKVNDRIKMVDPTATMLPMDLLEELLDNDVSMMKEELRRPLTFSYVRGHIKKLSTEEKDPDWSVDMKRAILSLLEMNFNERQSLDSHKDLESATKLPVMYRVIEPSVSGECETLYSLKMSASPMQLMKVHKIRNLDKCLEKPIMKLDMLDGPKTEKKEEEAEVFSAQSSVSYTLQGSPDKFIILSAIAQSQYNLVPYSENNGRLTTLSNQSLILMEKKNIAVQIREPESPKRQEKALQASLKDNKPAEDEKEVDEIISKTKMVLNVLEHISEEKIVDELPELLVQLRELGRKLKKEPLIKLVKERMTNKRPSPAASKLMDILPSIGTAPAVDALIHLIKEDLIRPPQAILSMMSLSLLPKPDSPIISSIKDFVKEDISRDKMVKRAAWLCLGSLGRKLMREKESMFKSIAKQINMTEQLSLEANDRRVRSKLDKLHQQLISKKEDLQKEIDKIRAEVIQMVTDLKQKDDIESKLLAVKVSGALGFEELVSDLAQIIKGPLSPRPLKLEAITSLAQMTPSQKVCGILLPVFLSHEEPEEIRMLALKSCHVAGVSRPELEMVALSLHRESSINVGSFVLSLLKHSSEKSPLPDCIKSLTRNTTLAARFAQGVPQSLDLSNYLSASIHDEDLKMSTSYEHTMLYSSKDRFPAVLSVVHGASLLGKSADILEVGYKAEGLGPIADALMGTDSPSSVTKMIEKLLNPKHRRVVDNLEQKIKDIKEKVGIKPLPEEKPQGHLYVKVFGQELIYVDLEALLPSTQGSPPLLKLLGSVGELLNFDKSSVMPLQHVRLPTEMGLPLNVRITAVSALSLHTDLQPDPSATPHMQMLLNIKPRALVEVRGEMEIDMKYICSGVSVKTRAHVHTPVSMAVTVDLPKSKVIIKVKDEQIVYPMRFHVIPSTVVRRLPSQAQAYPLPREEKEIPVVDGVDRRMFSHEIGEELLGRRVTLFGERPVRGDSKLPFIPLNGRMMAKLKYEPMSAKELHIQIQHVQSDDKDGEETSDKSSTWWSWLYGDSDDTNQAEGNKRKEDPNQGFINLEGKELSMKFLEEKFEPETPILGAGIKCGFVMRVSDPGPTPKHELQLSTLYQADRGQDRYLYSVEVRQLTRLPGRKPWKIVNSMDIQVPDVVIEPSDLQDAHYLNKLKQKIAYRTSGMAYAPHSLLDLTSHTIVQVAHELAVQQNGQILTQSLEDMINHVLVMSRGTPSQQLADLVQKQRQISRDIKLLKHQPIDSDKESALMTIRRALEKSDTIVAELMQQFGDQDKHPEKSSMVHYIILKQEILIKVMDKVFKRYAPVVLKEESTELKERLKEFIQKFSELKRMQREKTLQNIHVEPFASPELTDEENKLVHELQKLEEAIVSVSDLLMKKVNPVEMEKELSDKAKSLIDISTQLMIKIDKRLQKGESIHKVLRVKLLDVLLQKQILIKVFRDKITSAEKDFSKENFEKMSKKPELKRSEERPELKKLSKLSKAIEKKAAEISKRLLLAVSDKVVRTRVPASVRKHLEKLLIIEAKQVEDADRVKIEEPKYYDTDVKEMDKESSRKILKDVTERSKTLLTEIVKIIDEIKKDEQASKDISTVLMKSLEITIKQARFVDTIKEKSALLSLKEPVPLNRSPREEILKDIAMEADKQKEDAIKIVKQLEKLLKVAKPSKDSIADLPVTDLHSLPVDIQASKHSDSIAEVSALLGKAMKIHTHQSLLHEKVEKVLKSLTPKQPVPYTSKDKLPTDLLTEVITAAKITQEKLEELQREVSKTCKELPGDDSVASLVGVVVREYASQGSILKPLEEKLKAKSVSDVSLMEPLQEIQRLKDAYLRHEQIVKDMESAIKVARRAEEQYDHEQVDNSMLNDLPDTATLHQASDDRTDPVINIKAVYGHPGERMKQIRIKISSLKSLEQLLAEQDQVVGPRKADRMRKYKEDQQGVDDPLADQYRQIKMELNTNRHIQILSTYMPEDIPEIVQLTLLRLKELIKHEYFEHLAVSLPDHKNPLHQMEITLEAAQDDRRMSAELRTPTETVQLLKVPVPAVSRMVALDKSRSVTGHMSQAMTGLPPATCSIGKDRVRTLDGERIEPVEESAECEHVIMVDRSPRQRLLVTRRPGPKPGTMVVKILTKHQKIEITPDTVRPRVTVDGEHLQLDKPVMFRKDHFESLIVKKERSDRIHIQLPLLGVAVVSDGHKLSVQVPRSLRGQLAGLCGNYDNRKDNDREGPNKVKLSDEKTLAASFLIPAGKCDTKSIQEKYSLPAIREKSKQSQPREVTKMIKRKVGGVEKLCLSITPVKDCPSNTKVQAPVQTSVPFYCVPANSPAARRYRDLARQGVVEEIRSKRPDLHLMQQGPALCVSH